MRVSFIFTVAALVGGLVMLQAYVAPFTDLVVK
jgi:hypothetical protein